MDGQACAFCAGDDGLEVKAEKAPNAGEPKPQGRFCKRQREDGSFSASMKLQRHGPKGTRVEACFAFATQTGKFWTQSLEKPGPARRRTPTRTLISRAGSVGHGEVHFDTHCYYYSGHVPQSSRKRESVVLRFRTERFLAPRCARFFPSPSQRPPEWCMVFSRA